MTLFFTSMYLCERMVRESVPCGCIENKGSPLLGADNQPQKLLSESPGCLLSGLISTLELHV